MIKVYGIPNCNTVKKATNWLKAHNLPYEFHDYKKLGIAKKKLEQWAETFGWEVLLNKKGTTWKKLTPQEQMDITSPEAAYKLMTEKTSVIKRPTIESGKTLMLGFDEQAYEKALLN